MTKTITLKLTRDEAKALVSVIGGTTTDDIKLLLERSFLKKQSRVNINKYYNLIYDIFEKLEDILEYK